jgi:hypothetical protein
VYSGHSNLNFSGFSRARSRAHQCFPPATSPQSRFSSFSPPFLARFHAFPGCSDGAEGLWVRVRLRSWRMGASDCSTGTMGSNQGFALSCSWSTVEIYRNKMNGSITHLQRILCASRWDGGGWHGGEQSCCAAHVCLHRTLERQLGEEDWQNLPG